MNYYLGIDGGGTRTTAAVAGESGAVVYRAIGKTINFYSVGMDAARNNLKELLADIYEKLGAITFKSTFIGCSALDDRASDDIVKSLCDDVIKSENITMDSDTYVALFSGEEVLPRGVVICGTGSMVTAIDKNGGIHTKGGWGHIIGDGGSAYSIAVNGLTEAVQLFDENKTDAPLVKAAQSFFEMKSLRLIIDKVYSEATTKDVLAGFARLVAHEALKGDEASINIIKTECDKLLRTVYSLLDEIGDCKILYLYGGVFQNNPTFKELFVEALNEKYPTVRAELLSIPPEEGALRIAREQK